MNMREKIADSIKLHTTDALWTPEGLADAILDTLSEPTEGMCHEGDKVLCDEIVCNCDEGEIFRAMIQAAKEGK